MQQSMIPLMTIGMTGMRRISEANEETERPEEAHIDVAAAEQYLATRYKSCGYGGRRLSRDLTAAYFAATRFASQVQNAQGNNVEEIELSNYPNPAFSIASQMRRLRFAAARPHSIEDDISDECNRFPHPSATEHVLPHGSALGNNQDWDYPPQTHSKDLTNPSNPPVPIIYVPAKFPNNWSDDTQEKASSDQIGFEPPICAGKELHMNRYSKRHAEDKCNKPLRPVSAPLPDETSGKLHIPVLWINEPGTPDGNKTLDIPRPRRLFPDYSARSSESRHSLRLDYSSPVRLSPSSSPRGSPRPASSPRDSPRPPSFLRPPSPPLEDIEREELSHITCL